MKLLTIFLLVTFNCLAQFDNCDSPDKININQLAKIQFDQPQLFMEVIADSIVDTYTLKLPCESWSIYDKTINCAIKKPLVFNPKGRFILTDDHIEKGICFCESCSKAARTVSNNNTRHYVSGKNCKGAPEVVTVNKVDKTKPKWLQQPITKGTKFNLSNLIFYPNKSMFMKSSYIELEHLLKLLHSRPELKIAIQGHVNGPKQKNISAFQKLSENRAKAVREYLVKNGVDQKRIEHQGFGNTKMLFPKPSNDREMKKNRRVEILVK